MHFEERPYICLLWLSTSASSRIHRFTDSQIHGFTDSWIHGNTCAFGNTKKAVSALWQKKWSIKYYSNLMTKGSFLCFTPINWGSPIHWGHTWWHLRKNLVSDKYSVLQFRLFKSGSLLWCWHLCWFASMTTDFFHAIGAIFNIC